MTNARTAKNARDKAAALRADAARREARRRSTVALAVVTVVVVVIVAAFVLIQNQRHTDATANAATPANLGANNSIVVGKSTAPVTVVAYEDFQCPICEEFEQANAAQLQAWVAAGTVKIEYRPVAILDRNSADNYSTRSLNAAAAVVNTDPAAFQAFHDALYANQPAEGGPGLTDDQLIADAVAAGASRSAVAPAIQDETYKGWTVRVTDAFSKAGYNGTPTVLVNGKQLSSLDAATLKAAVNAAAK